MNYELLYEKLYKLGYHGDGTNSGVKEVQAIIQQCSMYGIKSILDAGCSQGRAVTEYLNGGLNARGFDISPHAIQLAQENHLKNRCVVGSILNIPFADRSFDALVSSDVLEHLDPSDVDLAISEIIRVTRKYLFLRISKGVEGRKDWLEKLKAEYPGDFDDIENLHLSVYSRNHWRDRIENKGATLISKYGKMMVFKIN